MSVTLTMTWAGGVSSTTSGGFVLTDDRSVEHQLSYDVKSISNIKNPAMRAVAEELTNQAGSATGTVTVAIA